MFIDTSSLFPFYILEDKSEEVEQLITEASIIRISTLTEVEIISSLKKRERMNQITAADVKKTYLLFKEHVSLGLFDVLNVEPSFFRTAERFIEKTSTPLRTLDAIHLATVYEYRTKLLTFDKALKQAADEFELETVSYESG